MRDDQVLQAQKHIPELLSAVQVGDLARVYAVYGELAKFGVDGTHAAVMLLADHHVAEMARKREQLVRLNRDVQRFAEAHMDQRQRIGELRSILDARAAAAPTRKAKEAA